ncbi:hypothetical protein DMP14_16825 [Pseudonocardia sp. Ae707_Ps2]
MTAERTWQRGSHRRLPDGEPGARRGAARQGYEDRLLGRRRQEIGRDQVWRRRRATRRRIEATGAR